MNKYSVIIMIGEGAQGSVFKAKCNATGHNGKFILHMVVAINKVRMKSSLAKREFVQKLKAQ